MINPPSGVQDGARGPYRGAERMLQVLRMLAEHPDGVDLAQIARSLDAPKSSTHRALAILRSSNFAVQDDKGRYRVGLGLVHLVFKFLESIDHVGLIRPVLGDLARQLGETAHYGVRDGTDVVYLAKVSASNQPVQMSSIVGGRNPLHCTGVGKALLAYDLLDMRSVSEFVESAGPLVKRTPNTIVTAADLAAELTLVRSRGYAVDNEENELGICCVALPVFFGSPTRPTGAVSVTALVYRTRLEDLESQVKPIISTITQRLGEGVCGGSGYST